MSIATDIAIAQESYLKAKIHGGRWKSIRASGIADPCLRRIFYYLTVGELAKEPNIELQAIFEEGHDQEPTVRRYLSELGFEIIRSQMTESWPEYNISGSIDGILERDQIRYICEIKTVSDNAFEKLKTIEDFDEGYYKKWFGQIQLYMLLFNIDRGLFILKKKSAKFIRVIEVSLDYSFAESLLKKAEIVNGSLKTNEPPSYLANNPVECKRCPFFSTVCTPPMDYGDRIVDIDDPELSKKLQRRYELDEARKEFEVLDKELKTRFREIPDLICGDFHVVGKERVVKYQAKEASESKQWIMKIEKITDSAINP